MRAAEALAADAAVGAADVGGDPGASTAVATNCDDDDDEEAPR